MRIPLLAPLYLFILLLCSCFTRNNQNIEKESTRPAVRERSTLAVTKAKNPPRKANSQILKANVYLEISGGMVGFMPQGGSTVQVTKFQDRVASLLTEVNFNPIIKNKDFYYIRELNGNAQLVKEDYQHVLKTVSSGTPHPALGTELPDMLRQIIDESGKTDALSVVVSDFIYGPANKNNFSIISQLIRGGIHDAKKRGLVISVFGDQSAFHGIYYPAVKVPRQQTTLSGTKIPFYIWVIGKQEEVLLFNKKILKNQPLEQAHYGFRHAPPYAAVPKYNSSGIVFCSSRDTKDGCKSVTMEFDKNEPVEFEVGVNLNQLPANIQGDAYLKNNLKLNGNGISATILGVKKATEATKADADLAKFSHFIRLNVSKVSVESGKLELVLPEKEPSWINQWTTTNDNDPVKAPGKTFKLNEILRGVENLYSGGAKSVFKLSINYIKE